MRTNPTKQFTVTASTKWKMDQNVGCNRNGLCKFSHKLRSFDGQVL